MSSNFNISVIGDTTVGKTCIANAILKKQFDDQFVPTIGASMFKAIYDNSGITETFYIWDTAGMEKYRALAPIYYRDSVAAIVVYDVTKRNTFEGLSDWIKSYHESAGESAPILIVGNKIDLEDRKVQSDEGCDFAQQNNCKFLEVSAKTGVGIENILPILSQLLSSIDFGDEYLAKKEEAQVLDEAPQTKKCCN
ncbi:ras-related protein Rab-31-like [Histomonas meleagridis]|uniref:ras-related protein Rab-31-like n=1 Tax=Histomonas meleagridis TaxID=135588 RepID=UPI003559E86A|nr:ras-related protein Rab-31-like [Histomonas meleagridis]KAH0805352.1 ras-related protein Rab-31-like [Histomonas meleagridis]